MAASRARALLRVRALQGNFATLRELAGGPEVLPMIKADAYGHGAAWAAHALDGLPGLAGFGVASVEEGILVRRAIRGRTRIHVFSGSSPWTEEKGRACERHGLAPVVSSEEDWRAFKRQGWPARIAYELKFNTGMNRLGLEPALAPRLAREIAELPGESAPLGVLTHLAQAEDPESRVSVRQAERFAAVRAAFATDFPATRFHLANSSAIFRARAWRLAELTDVVRPGLALYGIPPWPGAPARGLEAALTFEVEVAQVRRIARGESVGYGATFTARGEDAPVEVATLGAGYADGVPRSLSGRGHAWAAGRATGFIGRVSMDLSAIRAPKGLKAGDWVQLLGPRVDPWAQAEAAGTVPYELLTSISARVQRENE